MSLEPDKPPADTEQGHPPGGAPPPLLTSPSTGEASTRSPAPQPTVSMGTARAPSGAMRVTEQPGDHIGPFRLIRPVGAGGMGQVWLAEQSRPVRRRVALKLIKPGMDSREVLARFESERQALAMMNHANVAAVYDAGATDAGRPYFVMEYVAGVPITAYCDQHRLTVAERLELFTQVCAAVQHAHQKGIIHRDIKPSNVLVSVPEASDARPVVKVIDFGVAKAVNQRLSEQTVFTQVGQLVGTPEYMSPEQAEMSALDVDTRSDIYSLGVLLYELLTGTLPFDSTALRRAGFGEIQRIIREVEPPKPSTRLSVIAAAQRPRMAPVSAAVGRASREMGAPAQPIAATISHARRTDVRALHRHVRGDLDWITMKAMEKDRTRRYSSANELAADLVRHLKNEPVLAGAPSAMYRLRKFERRHRLGVHVVLFVMMVLLGAGLVSARAIYELRQRQWGDRFGHDVIQQQSLYATVEALREGRMNEEYGGLIPFQRSVLSDSRVLDVCRSVEAAALRELVLSLKDIGDYEQARQVIDKAKARRYSHRDEAWLQFQDAVMLIESGATPSAVSRLECEADTWNRTLSSYDAAPVNAELARWLIAVGRISDAEASLARCLRLKYGPRDRWLFAYAKSLLGGCRFEQGRYSEAEDLLLEGFSEMQYDRQVEQRLKAECAARLIELNECLGNAEEANLWRCVLRQIAGRGPVSGWRASALATATPVDGTELDCRHRQPTRSQSRPAVLGP